MNDDKETKEDEQVQQLIKDLKRINDELDEEYILPFKKKGDDSNAGK